MHDRSLEVLELPKVLAQVAREANFSVGRERVLGLEPTPDLGEASERLAWTREAMQLLERQPRFGVGGAHDVRPQVRRAAREGELTPADLVSVLATLRAAMATARLLQGLDEDGPWPSRRAAWPGRRPDRPGTARPPEPPGGPEGGRRAPRPPQSEAGAPGAALPPGSRRAARWPRRGRASALIRAR